MLLNYDKTIAHLHDVPVKEMKIPSCLLCSNPLKRIALILIYFNFLIYHIGYWTQETTFLADVDKTKETTYYDSVTGTAHPHHKIK